MSQQKGIKRFLKNTLYFLLAIFIGILAAHYIQRILS